MKWGLSALGTGSSVLLMLLLGMKWKFPKLLTVIGVAVIAGLTALPFFWIYPLITTNWGQAIGVFGQTSAALALGLSLILLRFWRDPERVPPGGDGLVLSAADGKVLYVKTVDEGTTPWVTKGGRHYLLKELTGTSLLASSAHVIGVEMSFLDVHVTRCPIAGQVKLQKHIEGRFMSLGKDEAPFVNARLTTIIENVSLTTAAVQVASRLVRRVESYLSVGERISAGQRLGMIRFGSLVTVVLPQREDVRIEVKPGDRVTAGVSVLARYQVNDERTVN